MTSRTPVDQAVGPLTMAGLLGQWRAAGPAYQQLAGGIRRLVADGRLPMQSRLPAERHLAVQLGVSRNTVTAAYERLREEGYLDSRQGSGTWTTLPDRPAPRGERGATDIDLTVAAPAAPPGLQAHITAAVAGMDEYLGLHGYEPFGLPVLRAAVATHLSDAGLPTRDTQVLITNGAGQALDLVVRALLRRGGVAMVESPTYPTALDTFRAADVRLVHVPVSAAGWDLAIMRSTFKRTQPGLAYLVPDFQNPTGALIDDASREQMLAAAMAAGCHVVSDHTFLDLRLEGNAMPRMVAQIADDPRVLTVGSMSKAFWGGLRIGWIRATPTMVQRLARVRATQDLASPVIEQLVAARLLASPERILAAQRRRALHQRDALAAALKRRLPDWRWTLPAGGLSLWVELPQPNSESLADQALVRGVRLAPGPRFGVPGTMERFVRIPFSLPAPTLDDAVERLADAASASLQTTRSRRGPAFVA
jgi:DNA-binding transcriptional MocR family regulator